MNKAIERIVSAVAVLIVAFALSACSGEADDGNKIDMPKPGLLNNTPDSGAEGGNAGAGSNSHGGSGSSGASHGGTAGNDPDSGSHTGGQDTNPEGGAGGSGDGDSGDGDPDPDGGSPGDGDGDSGTGGTGGSDSGNPQVMEPFSFSTLLKDSTFITGRDFPNRAWATGANDVYVPLVTYGQSQVAEIAHKDGNGWSVDLAGGTYSLCDEIAGTSPTNVYAACQKVDGSFPKGVILKRNAANDWSEVKVFGIQEAWIQSITCQAENDCFAVVQHCDDATHCYPTVWRGSGTSWTSMTSPTAMNGSGNRIRCFSGQCYVVGGVSSSALLWRLEGDIWTAVTTLPGDVTALGDLGFADGQLTLVGSTSTGGVALWSDDLLSWDRSDHDGIDSLTSVWSPWGGAALVGGSHPDGLGGGDATLCHQSQGVFGSETYFGTEEDAVPSVTSIIPLNDNLVLVTTAASIIGAASVYTASY